MRTIKLRRMRSEQWRRGDGHLERHESPFTKPPVTLRRFKRRQQRRAKRAARKVA